jgi:hypothetical protein
MPNRLRATMFVLAVSAALLACFLSTAAIGAEAHDATNPSTRTCSTAGLHFTMKQEGVTFSVAVTNLKAKVAACNAARSLATTVAKDILQETEIPTRIAGFKVTVKEPCTGCTPDTRVTAKSGKELIAFTVKGGA